MQWPRHSELQRWVEDLVGGHATQAARPPTCEPFELSELIRVVKDLVRAEHEAAHQAAHDRGG
jgi:hypothetical protein